MKKIVAFLTFLNLSAAAAAQDNPWHWNPNDSGAQDRTVVLADLVVDGYAVALDEIESHYLIGAFVDGECRGVAETVASGAGRWLQIEVMGNYGHTDDSGKTIAFRLYDKDSKTEYELSSSRLVVWNQATYGLPSADHVVLSVWTSREQPIVTFPATLTLSKLRDVQLTLTHTNPEFSEVRPDDVSITIAPAKNGWQAASATGSGLQWSLRGMAVGEYDYSVSCGGRPMLSDRGTTAGKLVIPAEVSFDNGWDWISSFVATPFPIYDDATGEYLPSLNIDANNKVIEIRSQHAAVCNDAELGIFGDLVGIAATDGAYKIKSTYEPDNDVAKVFCMGSAANGETTAQALPAIEPGYNWICYPHENDHSLTTLQPMLSATATEGDVIIGRDAFLEFDGTKWVGTLKTFRAGKGFIYYSAADAPFALSWGDYYLPQEDLGAGSKEQGARGKGQEESFWHYDALSHASSMPVVATLDGVDDYDRYSIGAFVGDECRGRGEALADRLFISVSGDMGEQVSFRLYDKLTGTYSSLGTTLSYRLKAGSLRTPLTLTAPLHGDTTVAAPLSMTYAGGAITVNAAEGPLTVEVRNLAGHVVLTSHDHVTRVALLPGGVYVVTATCANASKTIKISK